jgi:hypothetical protein
MAEILQTEVDQMKEEKLIENMKRIRKSFLSYDGIGKYDEQYFVWISSLEMLKIDTRISFDKYKENHNLKRHSYNKIADIEILKDNTYIYIN